MLGGLRRKFAAGVTVIAVAITAGYGGSALAIRGLRAEAERSHDTQSVIAEANRLEKLVIDLETGERGYVITHDDRFLQPWRNARREYPRVAARLLATVPDAAGRRQLGALLPAIDEFERDWTERVIRVARADPAVGRALVKTGGGKRRVDAIRVRFDAFERNEQRIDDRRRRDASGDGRTATLAALATLVVVLTLLAIFAVYLARTVVRPVVRVADAAEGVAGGDLRIRVPEQGDDEVARLVLAFNAMAESLENARRMQDEFVATVSHELRTPLTSIRGFVELLAQGEAGPVTDEQVRFLEIVDRNAERLHVLVSDLLLLAQADAGGVKLVLDDVDVRDVAREAVEAASPAAAMDGIELTLSANGAAPVRGDRARLAQVVDNLLSNAIKFTPRGGRVDVVVASEGTRVELDVRDTGEGISDTDQQRLFNRFFRTAEAHRSAVPGSGLGLAITKSIVEAHGGEISVRSARGSGTTFRVVLPLVD